jgi:hypothetical protein
MTYYISRFPNSPIAVEIEGTPPCLFCGEPVTSPSMDGPLVCGACDCGRNHDGSKWTEEQGAERWRHRREQVAKYREAAEARARVKEEA